MAGRPKSDSGKRQQRVDKVLTGEMSAALEAAEAAATKTRAGAVQQAVDNFLEKKVEPGKKGAWETEKPGLAPGGELLTLDDLIHLRPFAMEDLSGQIAFRANDKMMRAAQRVREASGSVYDIMSDLHRDAWVIGLLVLSERHKDILGMEVVISRAENHQRMKDEAMEVTRRFKEALKPLDSVIRKIHFHDFVEAMNLKPKWIQETYLEEIRNDKFLGDMLEELTEKDD